MPSTFFCNRANKEVTRKCLFCGLQEDAINEIIKSKTTIQYKKNQTVFMQGTPPNGFYWVETGSIKILMKINNGKEGILRLVTVGDVLDHHNIFHEQIYTTSAVAINDCTVNFLNKEAILNFVERYPKLSFNINSQLSQTIKCIELQNLSLSQKNVDERIAALLLDLKSIYGVVDNNVTRLDIKLTREEMALLAGTTHATLVRFMSEFKEQGILDLVGKTIYLTNEKKLQELANL